MSREQETSDETPSGELSALFAEGNLAAAQSLYQAAKEQLLKCHGSMASSGNFPAFLEKAVAARQILAVVCGNLAAVTSSVNAIVTIQVNPTFLLSTIQSTEQPAVSWEQTWSGEPSPVRMAFQP